MSSIGFKVCQLTNRSLINIAGRDAFSYVQTFTTCDVRQAAPAVYGLMVNAAGKTMADLMCYVINGNPTDRQLALTAVAHQRFGIDGEPSDSLILECDSKLAEPVRKTFFTYKIRRQVTIAHAPEFKLFSLIPDVNSISELVQRPLSTIEEIKSDDLIITRDPRIGPISYRILSRLGHDSAESLIPLLSHLTSSSIKETNLLDYHLFRYKLGIAEGMNDYRPYSISPLDLNVDYMNGYSLTKGQFIGKDQSSRRKLRDLTRLRLMPVEILLPLPKVKNINFAFATHIVNREGGFIGQFLSRKQTYGLALINLNRAIRCNFDLYHKQSGAKLSIRLPFWWPRETLLECFSRKQDVLPSPSLTKIGDGTSQEKNYSSTSSK
ncbi:iron-sulfur cluster assembly factor IBA57, mitochondrial-like [Brevipalpus obovatus]|uniref:iron-sulfur cluster assembly factor IBA57, mitochondrial-like n=1 Tax=Brevipalpus obovatus TaxID=246614 RepID=UPI003D9EF137